MNGKSVLVGATAIEMGDRYATQAFGVQPGVVIQAMATETLLQQFDYRDYGILPFAILAALVSATMGLLRPGVSRTILTVITIAATALIPFIAEFLKIATFGSSAAIFMIISTFISLKVQHAMAVALHRRMTDVYTGLPNMLSLQQEIVNMTDSYLFVMNITNLGELLAMVGEACRTQLYDALVRRIQVTDRASGWSIQKQCGIVRFCSTYPV